MTRPSRRIADYAPSTLEFSAELVLAAAVEEAVSLLRAALRRWSISVSPGSVTAVYLPDEDWQGSRLKRARAEADAALYAATVAAELILGRAR
jgi:hypothetical protein